MKNLTLAQVFGLNANQSSGQLVILKSDLPGLTPGSNNRAEQLLVALLLKVAEQFEGNLTDPSGQVVTDNQNNAITYDNSKLYERMKIFYWKRQFTTREQQSYSLDTFVIDTFFAPPPAYGSAINLALWG
jgi:hypothetical protein